MKNSVQTQSSTIDAFAHFRRNSPKLSFALIMLMASSIVGMAIFSMIERGQEILIPFIVFFGAIWALIYVKSDTKKYRRVRAFAPRLFLGVVIVFLLTGFVRDSPSIVGSLFIFPFILLSFLSVPAKEAFVWSVVGVLSVLGVSYFLFERSDINTIKVDDFIIGVFGLSILAQLSITYLLNGSARASAFVAEEQRQILQESNTRYQTLFESIDQGLIITDEKGKISFANNEAQELLKMKEDDLEGAMFDDMVQVSGESSKKVDSPFEIVTSRQDRYTQDFTSEDRHLIERSDDSSFLVAYSMSPVFYKNQLRGTIFLFRDISDLYRMDKAKTEFVSLASHQLRTPLSVINWYSEKLLSKKKGALNEKQEGYLFQIEQSNQRMSKLVNELLSVSRAELGKVKVSYEDVDMISIVQQLYSDVHQSAAKRSIEMNVTVKRGDTILRNSDKSLVDAIVQNLFTNAIKYSLQGSVIEVHLEQVSSDQELPVDFRSPARGLLLSVKDSGVGIPKDQSQKIFSKMFRAENVQTMNVDGTGLGLYLSKQFSVALSGNLWFESVEGQGSTFYLYLPFSASIQQKFAKPKSVKSAFNDKIRQQRELFR